MIRVVVLEFAVVLVEDGVDFCGGGFLALVFCPDELEVGGVGGEGVKLFGCESLQEVVRAGDLLEAKVAFLAGDVWMEFLCESPEG